MRTLLVVVAVFVAAAIVWPHSLGAAEATGPVVVHQVFLPLVEVNAVGGSSTPPIPGLPSVEAFIASVTDGQAGVVRGVYVPDVLALPVRQQPANNPNYVSPEAGTVTQFAAATYSGVTGLLAHNYLAGADFFKLAADKDVLIVFGGGAVKRYTVTAIYRYQALDPYSPYSDFVDLSTGETKTVGEVFSLVYTGGDHVTFQTCIERDGNSSWGRLFVIASP